MNAGLRIFALIVLVIGIICIYFGLDLSHSLSNKVMKQMAGSYPEHTKRYFMWGAAMIVVGVIAFAATFFKRKK